jgi:hypothetical protein
MVSSRFSTSTYRNTGPFLTAWAVAAGASVCTGAPRPLRPRPLARARHLDQAARASAIPHLDSALLTSKPRPLRPPASPACRISAPRACARESHAQIYSSRSRPRVSRSRVDGHADNRAVSHRAALATPSPADPSPPSPGMPSRVRRSETISPRRIYLRRMRFWVRTWQQDALPTVDCLVGRLARLVPLATNCLHTLRQVRKPMSTATWSARSHW